MKRAALTVSIATAMLTAILADARLAGGYGEQGFDTRIRACVNADGAPRIIDPHVSCRPTERLLEWSVAGAVGPQGPPGTPAPAAATAPGSSAGAPFALPYKGQTSIDARAAFEVVNSSTTNAWAIQGTGKWGLLGWSSIAGGVGIAGYAQGAGSDAVMGVASGGDSHGVEGTYRNDPHGSSLTRGLLGTARDGVQGESNIPGGRGVSGWARSGGSDAAGVYGRSGPGGRGVVGVYDYGAAAFPTRGYLGTSTNGVQGESLASEGIGVLGISSGNGGKGIAGKAEGTKLPIAVYGESKSGLAGFFRGKVTITESLLVTDVYAKKVAAAESYMGPGVKAFRIDHPLDPAGKFLLHSSVESDAMKNMYDGVVTLDGEGAAWVVLPEWFEVLNQDFRYQLTCLGRYAPVFIAREVEHNRFQIAGGTPGLRVSWLVTGIRHDAYARAHPLVVEPEKSGLERGKYQNPKELGFPERMGIR